MADDREFESEEKFHQAVKRQFDRRQADHLPVRIVLQGAEYDGTLEDISKGGVRIRTDADIPERGSVKVHVPIKGEKGKEMHLTGVIRWTETVTEAGIELTSKTRDV